MYQKLSKDQVIKKLLETELERNNLIKLYLTADSLIRDSSAYIIELLTSKALLEDEISNLLSSDITPFNVKEEMEKIKAELRALEEKEKGENSNDGKEKF